MTLSLYNTRTRQKEPFVPLQPGRVTMYVCGPTVYSFPHIGNARPAVVFDVLARLLRTRYQLVYARNITDIDDKINRAAAAEGVPIGEIAARYASAYHADMRALGVLPPDIEPRATEHLAGIIRMISGLIDSGHAYAAEGHVLFRVSSFSDYGALSRRDQRELLAGARVEVAPYKEGRRRLRAVEALDAGPAWLGQSLGPWPARLAYRVLGDGRRNTSAPPSTSTAAATT